MRDTPVGLPSPIRPTTKRPWSEIESDQKSSGPSKRSSDDSNVINSASPKQRRLSLTPRLERDGEESRDGDLMDEVLFLFLL